MAAPLLIVKQNDTYPSWLLAVTQGGAWLDLSDVDTMTLYLNSTTVKPIVVVDMDCTPLSPATITANLQTSSAVLTSVSSFTNIRLGTTILAEGVPNGSYVTAFDSTAATVTLNDPATATTSGVSVTVGQGQGTVTPTSEETSVADTYTAEVVIVWTGGSAPTQTIPNAATTNPEVEIDAALNRSV